MTHAAADDATRAGRDLATVLERTAEELVVLAARARELERLRSGGQAWSEIVPAEERPLVVERLTSLLDELADSGARFRRAEARALRAEGLSQAGVAALFGVTRQRVSALLAPPPPSTARARHRPPARG